jgi:hypothetical protein
MTDQTLRASAASSVRTVASGLLVAVTAASLLLSAWLDPSTFLGFFEGDTTNLGLALPALIPLPLSAILWLFRNDSPAVWWLAWTLTSAMTAFGLVLAVGFHAMGQAIKADGLLPDEPGLLRHPEGHLDDGLVSTPRKIVPLP